MKYVCRTAIVSAVFAATFIAHAIDFNASMKLASYPQILQNANNVMLLDFFKRLYDQHSPEKMHPAHSLKIPTVMHQIWLGGKLPAEYEGYRESWLRFHPDWIHIFWTDSPENYDRGILIRDFSELEAYLKSNEKIPHNIVIDARHLNFDNKEFYDAAINYGEKSDILKWEIVYRFGGVYVDTDYECLKSLDILHYTYDFYTGIQPLDTNRVQLGAALYAARPKHPIMQQCVERIKENQHIQQIVLKTGPLHFTKIFYATAGQHGFIDIALPASYLYPCGYEQKGKSYEEWQQPESFAVHHWAGSWLKPEGFVNHRKK